MTSARRKRFLLQRWPLLLSALLTAALLAINIGVAGAHGLAPNKPHWDKGGGAIHIYNYIYGTNQQAAEAARVDGWNKISILYNYRVNYHTHISVFDGSYGNTGWAGLASLEDLDWSWGHFGWLHIAHAHARYNTSYSLTQRQIQGTFCHEIGHAWGLGHDDTPDCLNDPFIWPFYSSHNNTDFDNFYRFHRH